MTSARARSADNGTDLRKELSEALLISSIRQHELIEQIQKADAALRASEERATALFNAVPAAVFACDATGRIQQYNRNAAELWEREPNCEIEMHCGSVRLWLPNGSLLPHDKSPIMDVLQSGRAIKNVELFMERPDGSKFPALINFGPLKDSAGELIGAIASFVDLSDRKIIEDKLSQSEARFRLLAEEMPQKVFTANPKGDFTYLNPQWMSYTGVRVQEMKGWSWTMVIHTDDLDENMRLWQKSIDTGEPLRVEHRIRQADCEYRWHLTRAVAMRNAEGEVTMWVGSSTDIDDTKRAEDAMRIRLEREVVLRTAELLATNEQLQGFTYSVAHDLRQQIRGISSNASILITDSSAGLDEEGRLTLTRLVDNAKKLARLVDDLLNYARLGTHEPSKQAFDVSGLAEEVAAFLMERSGCNDATRFVIAPGLIAHGDALLIRVVIENLFNNACKYSSETENPVIEFGREGGAFFVRDNGIGFDMQYLHKLFQPFERLHRDSAYAGTGIGLANVKRIVEKHGGEVRATGKLGQGATFCFTLP